MLFFELFEFFESGFGLVGWLAGSSKACAEYIGGGLCFASFLFEFMRYTVLYIPAMAINSERK